MTGAHLGLLDRDSVHYKLDSGHVYRSPGGKDWHVAVLWMDDLQPEWPIFLRTLCGRQVRHDFQQASAYDQGMTCRLCIKAHRLRFLEREPEPQATFLAATMEQVRSRAGTSRTAPSADDLQRTRRRLERAWAGRALEGLRR